MPPDLLANAAWHAAEGDHMGLFWFIVVLAVITGIVAVVVEGLLWLLAVAILVLVADFIFLGARLRGGRKPSR